MGRELIPFVSMADAAAFKDDHNGKHICSFVDITLAVLEQLD